MHKKCEIVKYRNLTSFRLKSSILVIILFMNLLRFVFLSLDYILEKCHVAVNPEYIWNPYNHLGTTHRCILVEIIRVHRELS